MSAQKPSITFITSNPNKLAEVRKILMKHDGNENKNNNDDNTRPTDDDDNGASMQTGDILAGKMQLKSRSLDLVEIQGKDVQEIARDKCRRAQEVIGGPVLTEDTALEFHALNGLPGPYIKYFLSAIGLEGLNNLLAAYPNSRGADAVCTFALSLGQAKGEENEPLIFQGRTEGTIVKARGGDSFACKAATNVLPTKAALKHAGVSLLRLYLLLVFAPHVSYAELLQPGWDPIFEYEGKTYAEMEKEEKNRISHRFKALEKLRLWLEENYTRF